MRRGGPSEEVDEQPARTGVLIAEGWTLHATVDATTLRPTRVPAWLMEAIASAEQPEPAPAA